jgi:hypothetical protein
MDYAAYRARREASAAGRALSASAEFVLNVEQIAFERAATAEQ